METNKLLTLEEIENLEKSAHARALVGNVWFEALLATARAYCMLEKAAEIHLQVMNDTKPDDKPHPATLKVIMEAMKESNDYIWVDPVGAFIPMFSEELFIKSLEKHLE